MAIGDKFQGWGNRHHTGIKNMGFAQVWHNDKAFNIKTKEFEVLPFNVKAAIPDTESSFYIIPSKIPYGLEEKDGSLIVCETRGGGVAIKGWRFADADWNICSLDGGLIYAQFSRLIEIESEKPTNSCTCIWKPDSKEPYTKPGSVKWYNGNALIDKDLGVSFKQFMFDHHPCQNRS